MPRASILLIALLVSSAWSQEITAQGPDAGGYGWISSRHPDGPEYRWENDININVNYNFAYMCGPFELPFAFPYYNASYSSLWISPTGLISFVALRIRLASTSVSCP